VLQLICLMGIRKLMDYAFSPIEMYWLDHMLPGEERVKREDEMVKQLNLRCLLLYRLTSTVLISVLIIIHHV